MTKLDSYSRFSQTQETIYKGNETYGMWSGYDFLNRDDVATGVFRVPNHLVGRPDRISARLYGTPLLDWAIIAFNNPSEILGWPHAGELIKYPLDSEVFPSI